MLGATQLFQGGFVHIHKLKSLQVLSLLVSYGKVHPILLEN